LAKIQRNYFKFLFYNSEVDIPPFLTSLLLRGALPKKGGAKKV
jgi:hypothetical protein